MHRRGGLAAHPFSLWHPNVSTANEGGVATETPKVTKLGLIVETMFSLTITMLVDKSVMIWQLEVHALLHLGL